MSDARKVFLAMEAAMVRENGGFGIPAQALRSALRAAADAGFVMVPENADTFMVNAYRDHEHNPARSVQSTWRRMVEAAPDFIAQSAEPNR